MYRPIPLGLSSEVLPPAGTAPYGGSNAPGPLGTVPDQPGNPSEVQSSKREIEAVFDGSASVPFALGTDTYRLRKVDHDWRPRSIEVEVPPEEAGAVIERAIVRHSRNVPLVRLLEMAAPQLAGLHEGGTFVLVWLRPQSSQRFVPTPPPAPPIPRPAPVPQSLPTVEEPVMAVAQAATLKNAAALGVPFCEECERLAAERRAAQTA